VIQGGRSVHLIFSSSYVIFSNLYIRCLDTTNYALKFNGVTSYAQIPTAKVLQMTQSFTYSAWIKLNETSTHKKYPILCDNAEKLCLYIQNKNLKGTGGYATVTGATTLANSQWYHTSMRYDAESYKIELFLNGTKDGTSTFTTKIESDALNENVLIGKGGGNFFHGLIDEVAIFRVYLTDAQIKEYIELVGLERPIHQKLLSAHYPMDHNRGTTIEDESGNNNHGQLHDTSWRVSSIVSSRFKLMNPGNKRKRRDVKQEL
jgi:hypothetical protein